MSMLPPSTNHDFEEIRWRFPGRNVLKDLTGRVFDSEKELRDAFKEKNIGDLISEERNACSYMNMSYIEFKIPMPGQEGDYVPVAYLCDACKKYVVGPPTFEDEHITQVLSGREGFYAKCKNCECTVYEKILALS